MKQPPGMTWSLLQLLKRHLPLVKGWVRGEQILGLGVGGTEVADRGAGSSAADVRVLADFLQRGNQRFTAAYDFGRKCVGREFPLARNKGLKDQPDEATDDVDGAADQQGEQHDHAVALGRFPVRAGPQNQPAGHSNGHDGNGHGHRHDNVLVDDVADLVGHDRLELVIIQIPDSALGGADRRKEWQAPAKRDGVHPIVREYVNSRHRSGIVRFGSHDGVPNLFVTFPVIDPAGVGSPDHQRLVEHEHGSADNQGELRAKLEVFEVLDREEEGEPVAGQVEACQQDKAHNKGEPALADDSHNFAGINLVGNGGNGQSHWGKSSCDCMCSKIKYYSIIAKFCQY